MTHPFGVGVIQRGRRGVPVPAFTRNKQQNICVRSHPVGIGRRREESEDVS